MSIHTCTCLNALLTFGPDKVTLADSSMNSSDFGKPSEVPTMNN